MNLRMIGLAAVVVTATLVPIVASAGPAAGPRPATGTGTAPTDDAKGSGAAGPGLPAGLEASEGDGMGAAGAVGTRDKAAEAGREESGGDGDAVPRTDSRCGPELASADGIEAQTCVINRGGQTWGRTYYRNATGEELTSVLALMAPGGRTVQTNCKVEAGDEPRTCETPREPSAGSASDYRAIAEFAEFAVHDGTGDGPLLLRSGSNSQESTGR
ncbi:hypothetical protein GLX30_18405 [Streptomyces sp. Tu 2975]|uniref:hypothetical protein n=1 Tax=Streptomyces sp. Tu 2975 TaxID=2676871 RepID=UPI001356DF27|nr:hypothetical protein [Streptomyces sp. Tu 2975]QIP85680.1 hypothetical protein GLX30_18405 [Streptomyces sp. Tu 2975]